MPMGIQVPLILDSVCDKKRKRRGGHEVAVGKGERGVWRELERSVGVNIIKAHCKCVAFSKNK